MKRIIEITQESLMNKLFCTFSSKELLEERLQEIVSEYVITYNKIFVLSSPDSDEYMCTYNIEVNGNTTTVLSNTILLHRKKETNTLYTINALNELVKSLNNGIADPSYKINWGDYRNSILLTQPTGIKKLSTKIHKIIEL
jgi:hypothetical protein